MTDRHGSRRDFGRPEPAGRSELIGYSSDEALVIDICRVIVALMGDAAQRSAADWQWHLVQGRLCTDATGEFGIALRRARQDTSEQDVLLLVCLLAAKRMTLAQAGTMLYGANRILRATSNVHALSAHGLLVVATEIVAIPEATTLEPEPGLAAQWAHACHKLTSKADTERPALEQQLWRIVTSSAELHG